MIFIQGYQIDGELHWFGVVFVHFAIKYSKQFLRQFVYGVFFTKKTMRHRLFRWAFSSGNDNFIMVYVAEGIFRLFCCNSVDGFFFYIVYFYIITLCVII